MLYDRDFLLKLDKDKNKIVYAKIIALTFDENPISTIEGRVTQGSINIDGTSAVRRTCSFTIVGQDFDYNNYYWGLNTKFKLEIGLQNFVDSSYPEIIWFKQGVYLITSFSTSRSATNFTISISGKDKMCLLNGEVGGSLESSVDFGVIEEEDSNGNWTITKVPIQDIIRHAVHVYGREPYHNIIINDLDTYGKELLEYRLDIPAYIYKKVGDTAFNNIILDGKKKYYLWKKSNGTYTAVKENNVQVYKALEQMEDDKFELLIDSLMFDASIKYYFSENANINNDETKMFQFAKMQYGDTIGYRRTDLTYAGDLIANVGESLTSILDKIKNMLVEFEYFYDLDGRFVFQKRKNYLNTMWGPEKTDEDQKPMISYSLGTADYVFNGGELITTFNNNPNLLNVRNDFSVWGERTTASGAKIPIHLRYAIDNKPIKYTTIQVDENDSQLIDYNAKYNLNTSGQTSITYQSSETGYSKNNDGTVDCDWREVIYQMAIDYYKYNFLDDFELRVIEANKESGLYRGGQTGYESYYIDLQGFWRQIYYPIEVEIKDLTTKIKDLTTEIKNENDKEKQSALKSKQEILENKKEALEKEKENYYSEGHDNEHWNKMVFEQPYNLNFWFDFLDTEGELKQFGVKSIGSRPKSIKDTNIKSIYFRETPELEIVENAQENQTLSTTQNGIVQIPDNYQNIFTISSQGKSAKEKLDELLYQHGYCIESVTLNTIPIYYLEPNSRIYINDEETNIIGYYNVSKIVLPLTYNGTMSLTATKVQVD